MEPSESLRTALNDNLLQASKWIVVHLSQYNKIKLVEEYLDLVSRGKLATCAFVTNDTKPGNRTQVAQFT